MPLRYLLILLLFPVTAGAQVLGGKNTYTFLDLPASPQITALGGMNVSRQGNDLSLAFLNPALLRPSMHTHLQVNYAGYFAGIRYSHMAFAFHHAALATTFATSLQFTGYGQMTHTDAAGNVLGTFSPSDFVWQLNASRRYLEKWYYGVGLKYIHSRYLTYRSSGLAADVGIAYQDTAQGWQAGLVARNMGGQLSAYAATDKEPLPFDLQVGVSKRLQHLPLQLSATLHHIYQFDIRYADPALEENVVIDNGDTVRAGGGTIDNIFRHFVLAAQFEIGSYVELTAAYNHLRRRELAMLNRQGLSGFSLGVGITVSKLQLRYARAWYQQATAMNHLGINLPLNQWMGLGKFGDRIGWKP